MLVPMPKNLKKKKNNINVFCILCLLTNTHTHKQRHSIHLLRRVCCKNDIHRRDSLRHRRVCLRVVVVRARATVSGACGRDRHSAAVAAKSTTAATDVDRDRPTDENRFVPKASPCVDRTPVGHAAPSDKLVCRNAYPSF